MFACGTQHYPTSRSLQVQSFPAHNMPSPALLKAIRPHLQRHQRLNQQILRCMSSQDKSWGEIASDAAQLARTAFNKATNAVVEVASKVIGPKEEERPLQQRPTPPDPYQDYRSRSSPRGLYRPPDADTGFLGNLMERAAGSLLNNAFGQFSEVMEEQGRQAADVKERALSLIQTNDQVRRRLGGSVQLLPGMASQSSSTTIVNGRATKRFTTSFLVAGSSGRRAQATAQVAEEGGTEEMTVSILMPEGDVIKVSSADPGLGGGAAGATIDVDWREVR